MPEHIPIFVITCTFIIEKANSICKKNLSKRCFIRLHAYRCFLKMTSATHKLICLLLLKKTQPAVKQTASV